MNYFLTRRQFMVLSGASLAALALNNCMPTPTPTKDPLLNGNKSKHGGSPGLGSTDKSGNTATFKFPAKAVVACNGGEAEKTAVINAITKLWNSYIKQDVAGYIANLTADVTRLSQRAGAIQQGREAVGAGLPAEWEAFEVSENMVVQRAELQFEQTDAPTFVTVVYWVGTEGGELWDYSDQGLVFQVWVRQDEAWLMAHHGDSWSLDYDTESNEPGEQPTFEFDFAYPVKNLERAVNFYKPLLGQPEGVSATRASFNLRGARLILDTNTFDDYAVVEQNLPNGYAIFYVNNVKADYKRLKEAEVNLLEGVKQYQQDLYAVAFDSAQNLFLIWQKVFDDDAPTPPLPVGFEEKQPFIQAAQAIATAWLQQDMNSLTGYYKNGGRWFDDTRLKTRGQERDIAKALTKVYWPLYDVASSGVAAKMEVKQVRVRPLGAGAVVSYEMVLTGLGSHLFQDKALVTHFFHDPTSVAHTFICANDSSQAMVLELDYTGYPVIDLSRVKKFYKQNMKLGEGYDDESYYGFWSNHAVFGLYEADPDEDNLPRKEQSNGYLSLWVHSADETFAYLKQTGCTFPVIPAINEVSGIDEQPGYRQIVATDSEGNVILFTEYTGE